MARWKRVRSYSYSEAQRAKRNSLQGPLRVARLCVLAVLLPGLLLSVPLYMRYKVFVQQAFPVGMSDTRLLDSSVSTTWCQRQVVWSNATFNAYLLPNEPKLSSTTEHVNMTRQMILEDDMKEYWGFYLLKDSIIHISACVRYPGASLIMIRGHKHLKQCAYIGDDSSEEMDEVFESDKNNDVSTDYDVSNKPTEMKKIKDQMVVEDADESSQPSAEESKQNSEHTDLLDRKRGHSVHLNYAEQEMNPPKRGKDKEEFRANAKIVEIGDDKKAPERPKTSAETYDDMLEKLRKMGPKGKTMLNQLSRKLEEEKKANGTTEMNNQSSTQAPVDGLDINAAAQISTTQAPGVKSENNTTEKTVQSKPKRRRRQVKIDHRMREEFMRHDTELDFGKEELEPDGIADHHRRVNETTPLDQSNSELWSSFSSSEERLLDCEGLLLNLPLTPHRVCEEGRPERVLARPSALNTVHYKVPSTGYYFFVFNSENEKNQNFLRVNFRLEKTTYDVSQTVAACTNQTGSCSLPLRFWSRDQVVLQLPVSDNQSLWNEEFLAVTTCEPRTALYALCVIAVPFLIVLFAFQ